MSASLPSAAVPEPTRARVLEAVAAALGSVEDPCMASAGLDLSILDLGLVYDVRLAPERSGPPSGVTVEIDLTFTELGCSFTHHVMTRVTDAVEALDGVAEARVRPVWRPGWSRDRMSPAARAQLGDASARLSLLAADRS